MSGTISRIPYQVIRHLPRLCLIVEIYSRAGGNPSTIFEEDPRTLCLPLRLPQTQCLRNDWHRILFPTANLVAVEILEDYGLERQIDRRGVVLTVSKSDLLRDKTSGVYLPRELVVYISFWSTSTSDVSQIDNTFLPKRSFGSMVENMPMLTTLILRNKHDLYSKSQDVSDKGAMVQIMLPSLWFFRLEYHFHQFQGCARCLLSSLVVPSPEVIEICMKHVSEGWYEQVRVDGLDHDSVLPMDGFAVHCAFNQRFLRHWNRPSSSLRSIRLESVAAPHRIFDLINKLLDIEYVYNHGSFEPERFVLLPLVLPNAFRTITFDLSDWRMAFVTTLLPELNDLPRKLLPKL